MSGEGLSPICFECKHFRGIVPGVGYTCAAFGEKSSIPIEIIVSSADHHEPYKGDNGIVYAAAANATDAEKKSLYVHRPLKNTDELVSWARDAGFTSILKPSDLHVTVAYSKKPIDWATAGSDPDEIPCDSGQRSLEHLGDEGAIVLKFESVELTRRWQEFLDVGASWDYETYQPHVTITYKGAPRDLDKIEPYRGPLIFGPEVFEELKRSFVPPNEEAINSLALDPPVSEAQRRLMWATKGGAKTGVPLSVAKEFTEADPGGKMPKRARDMTDTDWRGLLKGLLRFFWEESQEEEHQQPASDGIILNDECVHQIRNLLGEFRQSHATNKDETGEDTVTDPDRRVYGRYPEFHRPSTGDTASFEEIREAVASKASDPEALAAWIKDRTDPGWRSKRAEDRALAHDESPWVPTIAVDKEPTRTTDAAGHMHVKDTVLTKAVVSPYLGSEINGVMKDEPGWKLLDPDKTYHLLRDPEELKKSLDTFNGKPLLWVHRGVDASDHPADLVIGSTGTNARLRDDELTNDLVIWPKYATEAVEDGEKKSLSCGYGYKADMTPGDYKGHHYDGIMRNISGNHVALVDKPRVPGAKVGGDSMPDDTWECIAAALLAA